MSDLITHARNADLQDMVEILRNQQAHKLDLVIPAAALNFKDGGLVISGLANELTDDGFMDPNGVYSPTAVFDQHLADRLDIPVKYVRRMRTERTDIFDLTLNGWLGGRKAKYAFKQATDEQVLIREAIPADKRKFLLRLFRGDDGSGVARALLSDKYATMDNFDGLMAMLAGLKEAGVENPIIDRCDITDKRLYVRVTAPEIMAHAPELLKGYRNPFANPDIERWRGVANREGMGYSEEEGGEPIVFAGFTFSNSEVGAGRWQISPEIVVQVCKNGLVMTEDVFGKTHLGGRLEEGVIKWSAETQEQNIALVTAQTKDVVSQFMTKEYVEGAVSTLEEKAGIPVRKPTEAIKVVSKKLGFNEGHFDGLLAHFIAGGQNTAGGLMNAITSFSQTLPDADEAFDLNRKAVESMSLVAAL
jgi:hypothetical protein